MRSLSLALIGLFSALSLQADAATIQMLPPLQSTNTAVPCVSDPDNPQGDKYLTWDGSAPIKCQTHFFIDSSGLNTMRKGNGNFGLPATSGTTQPNATFRINQGNLATDFGMNADGTFWLQNALLADLSTNYGIALNPNGGNVGIGVATPSALLDARNDNGPSSIVFGGRNKVQTDGYDHVVDMLIGLHPVTKKFWNFATRGPLDPANPNGMMFQHFDGTNWVTPSLYFTQTGNVGVGAIPTAKLDVAGTAKASSLESTAGVKIGNDAAACAAAKAGTVRWTGAAMEYCNGTAWTAFGGGLPECKTFSANTQGMITGGTRVIYSHQMMKYTCPATYPRFLSGSCWRISDGEYIGNQNDPDGDGRSYLCRIEGSTGLTTHVTCCK